MEHTAQTNTTSPTALARWLSEVTDAAFVCDGRVCDGHVLEGSLFVEWDVRVERDGRVRISLSLPNTRRVRMALETGVLSLACKPFDALHWIGERHVVRHRMTRQESGDRELCAAAASAWAESVMIALLHGSRRSREHSASEKVP
jgi:hypothetical protein